LAIRSLRFEVGRNTVDVGDYPELNQVFSLAYDMAELAEWALQFLDEMRKLPIGKEYIDSLPQMEDYWNIKRQLNNLNHNIYRRSERSYEYKRREGFNGKHYGKHYDKP
jgi:hypothetical protein